MEWKKRLYLNQNVEDNYVDQSFLENLRKNCYVERYSPSVVAYHCGIISLHLSCTAVFLAVFFIMYLDILCPLVILAVSAPFAWFLNYQCRTNLSQDLLLLLLLYLISPLLHSLTRTVSTDTVVAMSIGLIAANLLLHDYGTENSLASNPLAINSIMFATVCLCSRLPTSLHAFALVTVSFLMFVHVPTLRNKIKELPMMPYIVVCSVAIYITSLLLLVSSVMLSVAFVVVQILLLAIFNTWFCRLQHLKNNIYGPWDEAVVAEHVYL